MQGVYKIQSITHPDRCYIGSSVNIRRRMNHHKNRLLNNAHHSAKLQNHVNKYGIRDLIFEALAECPPEEVINIEQGFIDFFNPYFNMRPTAEVRSGYTHSEETKKKISESHKGIRPSEETRKLLSEQRKGNAFNQGHKHSDESNQKNREAHIGKTWSEERKRAFSERMSGENNPFYGKKHSDKVIALLKQVRKLNEDNLKITN